MLYEVITENGLEAQIARETLTPDDGRSFPPGSVVFLAAQPYRPFLIEMMERQRFPEVRQGPDTREIFRPYDVTAWTLPLLMGVDRITSYNVCYTKLLRIVDSFHHSPLGMSPISQLEAA